MTEQDTTQKAQRVTKAALQAFIAEQEDKHDWHNGGMPTVWNEIRDFAGMGKVDENSLLDRKIEQVTYLLSVATGPEVKRQHRSDLMEMLRLLQIREDRAAEKAKGEKQ